MAGLRHSRNSSSRICEGCTLFTYRKTCMPATIRTVVTFQSVAFNTSEHRDYFTNPGCFGDDVAIWLIEELRKRKFETAAKPGQEDFGWYFTFHVSGIEYCLVIGYCPEEVTEEVFGLVGWSGAVALFLHCLVFASEASSLRPFRSFIKSCRRHHKSRMSNGTLRRIATAYTKNLALLGLRLSRLRNSIRIESSITSAYHSRTRCRLYKTKYLLD